MVLLRLLAVALELLLVLLLVVLQLLQHPHYVLLPPRLLARPLARPLPRLLLPDVHDGLVAPLGHEGLQLRKPLLNRPEVLALVYRLRPVLLC